MKERPILSMLFVIFLFVLLAPARVSSQVVIYVPDNYPTIQAAINAASSGTTIMVRAGMYQENIVVNKEHVVIRSVSGANSTIIRSLSENAHVIEIASDYVEVRDLIVEGSVGYSNLITTLDPSYSIGGQAGVFLKTANYCKVLGITFLNSDLGILLSGATHNNIVRNTFSGEGVNYGSGIHSYSSQNNTIENNLFAGFWRALDFISSNANLIKGNSIKDSLFSIGWLFSVDNVAYLNNFKATYQNIEYSAPSNVWNSPEQFSYIYEGTLFRSNLGNYWNDYSGSDANHDGIGDSPYFANSIFDYFPLIDETRTILLFCPSGIEVDKSLSNNVVTGSASISECRGILTIKNTKNYWTNFTISTVGSVTLEPAGDEANLYHTFGILPPKGLITYTAGFSEAGQAVTFFLDPTIESGNNAAWANGMQAILDVLPVAGLATFTIDVFQYTLSALERMPKLKNGLIHLFENPPNLASAIKDLVGFTMDESERKELGDLLVWLARKGGWTYLKQIKIDNVPILRVLDALRRTVGNLYTALFKYPAGSVVFKPLVGGGW